MIARFVYRDGMRVELPNGIGVCVTTRNHCQSGFAVRLSSTARHLEVEASVARQRFPPSGSELLVTTEGDHWVDAGRPVRGDVSGKRAAKCL